MRYPENRAKRVNMIPKAITFDSTVEFPISLVFWKLDIQSFPRIPSSIQSKSRRPSNMRPNLDKKKKLELLMSTEVANGRQKLKGHILAINTPRNLFLSFLDFGQFSAQILSLFLCDFSPKHIQIPLILLFSPQSQGNVLALNVPLLGFISWN